MSKILITGVNGFVGKHLVRELKSRKHKIVGIGLQPEPDSAIKSQLDNYVVCDLTNPEQVRDLPLQEVNGLISLAGLAQVGPSFSDPERYKHLNVAVLSVIASRILAEKLPIKILAISTGAVYEPEQPLPLTEDSKLTKSGSPYAQSKILMEDKIAELRKEGLDCVIARPFNHIGPGQEKGFLVPDLYTKIIESQKTGQPLMVGNLDTKRDYTDVRDVVRAYCDLIEGQGLEHELYSVCSSRSISGREILTLLLAACKVADKMEIKVDQTMIRPNDPKDIYGSYKRLKTDVGWMPQMKLEQTINDFVAAQENY